MNSLKSLIFTCGIFFTGIIFSISEFYFVRHGQTDFNIKKEKKYWNMPMNGMGKKQVENLQGLIQKLPIGVIFFSPLERTKETKDILNNYLNVCAIKLPEIKEAKESLFYEVHLLQRNKYTVVSKGLKKFLDKVSLGLDEILKSSSIPLVIGHGAVYSAICYILEVDTDNWHIANGAIAYFYKNIYGNWEVKLITDGSIN